MNRIDNFKFFFASKVCSNKSFKILDKLFSFSFSFYLELISRTSSTFCSPDKFSKIHSEETMIVPDTWRRYQEQLAR